MVQVAEVTANTGRGPRGEVLPAASAPGNRGENRLLGQTVAELDRLGFDPARSRWTAALSPVRPPRPGRAGTDQDLHRGPGRAGSRRTRRRLARYRTGCEGRISHLKRGSGLRRSRLKGDQGQRIWTGWAVLAYNLDTSPSTPPERIGHPAAPAPCQAHSSQALTPARFSGGSN